MAFSGVSNPSQDFTLPAVRSTTTPSAESSTSSRVAIPIPSAVLDRPDLTTLFDPPPLPSFSSQQRRANLSGEIHIRHPAYPKAPALAVFPSSDEGGINYNIAYYACCIIACNVWHDDEGRLQNKDTPFFSLNASPEPIIVPPDDILRSREYFFHVPKHDEENPYPVFSNFDDWQFPDSIPNPWRNLHIPTFADLSDPEVSTVVHDESCRFTRSLIAVEQAHIIPTAATNWFYDNKMVKYMTCPNAGAELDDFSNIIPLRADVHRLFDQSNLCIFPKRDPHSQNPMTLVTCVLRASHKSTYGDIELFIRYHNRRVLPLRGALPEFLFARFAWAIFNDDTIRLFRQKVRTFTVKVLQKVQNGENQWVQKKVTPSKLTKPRSGASTAARTGQKRTYDQACDDVEGVELDDELYNSDDSNEPIDENGPSPSNAIDSPFDYVPIESDNDYSDDSRPSKRSRRSSNSVASEEGCHVSSDTTSTAERIERMKERFSKHVSIGDVEQFSQLPPLSSSVISTGSSKDSAVSGAAPYSGGYILTEFSPKKGKGKLVNSSNLSEDASLGHDT